jgi:hypothetical protein
MQETPDQRLVSEFRERFRRSGSLLSRGIVTAPEYINAVLLFLSQFDQVNAEAIPALSELVPEAARPNFVATIRQATLPEFQWHPLLIGPGRKRDEEGRREDDLEKARIRAWAVEFLRFFEQQGKGDAGVEPTHP